MGRKLNCWENEKCGRESGGRMTDELGICIASTETRTDGINGGKNAGRACWPVAGTLCNGVVQGTFAMKLRECMKCDFYQLVLKEEGAGLQGSKEILARLGG
ncbi:MAG: hypothetical protein L0958_02490 [Candidatus Mariimomonas ferrooxydans]